MKPSPSGISERRLLSIPRGDKLNHASLYTVAASAIQIECFSSDDDDDGPGSDVGILDCPS